MKNNLLTALGEEKDDQYGWDDMPEFEQDAKEAYAVFKVRIENNEDLKEFSKLIGQNVTTKTRAIRFPAVDKNRNSLLRYVDEE